MTMMKRILLMAASLSLFAWVISGFGYHFSLYYDSYSAELDPKGWYLQWNERPLLYTELPRFTQYKLPGIWFSQGLNQPYYDDESNDKGQAIVNPHNGRIIIPHPGLPITGYVHLFLPHWLTNLIAWSLFFILWRKTRKPPKGHCQQCGYDLTGNESGACPECNRAVGVIA